jgi:hypothetical protein
MKEVMVGDLGARICAVESSKWCCWEKTRAGREMASRWVAMRWDACLLAAYEARTNSGAASSYKRYFLAGRSS